jgi:hypothetical protein
MPEPARGAERPLLADVLDAVTEFMDKAIQLSLSLPATPGSASEANLGEEVDELVTCADPATACESGEW